MQLRMAEATPSEPDSSDGEAAAGGLASGCCLDFSRVRSTASFIPAVPPDCCRQVLSDSNVHQMLHFR